LAHPEWLQSTAIFEMIEKSEQAAQIDRILGKPAAAIEPEDKVEGCRFGEIIVLDEYGIGFGKCRAVEHGGTSDNPARNQFEPLRRQAAGEVFSENGQGLLHALISRKAGAKEPKPLGRTVEIGQ